MALSSRKHSLARDKSPSRSPLSPTIIHYREKYEKVTISKDHRDVKRHHLLRKQSIRNPSRHVHQNERASKNSIRQPSFIDSLWEVHRSSNGRIYYYNVVTDQSQWERPAKEQLPSSTTKKSIRSKRISNDHNWNKQDLSKKCRRSTSRSTFISDNNAASVRSRSSYAPYRLLNNINRRTSTRRNNRHHHERRNHPIQIKSSLKKFRKDKRQTDEIILSTPISPPANEKIQLDLVDPIPSPNNSITNICIPLSASREQLSNYEHSSISLDQIEVQSSDSKQSIKQQIHEDLSSVVLQSSLCPSESTIDAILQLEHPSPVQSQCSSSFVSPTTNSNSAHIARYYRAELIEHLLNWPSTQIEREAIRLSNEQIRYTTCQLTSLRADLFSIRLRLERNRSRFLKYDHILVHQKDLLAKLQLIESDQI